MVFAQPATTFEKTCDMGDPSVEQINWLRAGHDRSNHESLEKGLGMQEL